MITIIEEKFESWMSLLKILECNNQLNYNALDHFKFNILIILKVYYL